jgi:hypothetical protein
MSNSNLPVKTNEDFVGEFEVMDLSDLKDKMFIVAINAEDRNKCKFLCSTVRGPYTFEEMCEQIGTAWKQHQHHLKATILEKDPNKAVRFLDENTTDYIQAHYEDIIVESLLGGVFDDTKEYTCRANLVEAPLSEDPRLAKKEEETTQEEVAASAP